MRVLIEKERLAPGGYLPVWVRNEHLARYRHAATFAAAKVVIDCACGDGLSSRLMAEAGATRVLGFDLSPDSVTHARVAHGLPTTHYEVADAAALPLPDETADLFVSLETIEHLDDTEAFLREVVRVLSPGGEFICSTPNRTVYSPGHTQDSRPWNRFHVHEFSREEFEELLGRHFERVTVYGQNLRSKRVTSALTFMGRLAPFDLAVRVNQIAKLPRYLYDKVDHHTVVALDDSYEPEYLVAVCSKPWKR